MLKGIVAAAVIAGPATAELYDDAALTAATQQMWPNIELLVREDIFRTLPPELQSAAAAIELSPDLRGRHPLDFYFDPGRGRIHVPMESVKFYDELAMLVSWFESKDCDPTPIATYLWALLRERRPLPPPLEAFGLDEATLLADPYTSDVAAKLLSSFMFFILSHEMGHALLRHRPGLTFAYSQQQEREADSFAIDRFAAIGTPPAGALVYFFAGRWIDPVGVAVAQHSHPVAPDRILAMAERMEAQPHDFGSGFFTAPEEVEAQVLGLAAEFRTLAEQSSDETMLTLLPQGLARDFPLTRLTRACPAEPR